MGMDSVIIQIIHTRLEQPLFDVVLRTVSCAPGHGGTLAQTQDKQIHAQRGKKVAVVGWTGLYLRERLPRREREHADAASAGARAHLFRWMRCLTNASTWEFCPRVSILHGLQQMWSCCTVSTATTIKNTLHVLTVFQRALHLWRTHIQALLVSVSSYL
eukprot:1465783-Amphidinium_carterae.1